MRKVVFKSEACRVEQRDPSRQDDKIEVRLWIGDGTGSWSSMGQPMQMSESAYISFLHSFKIRHEWKD